MDVESIRKDFPVLDRMVNGRPLVYFDNAATSQKPIQVIDAIKEYYMNHNANIHRGVHTLGTESTELYDQARKTVAEFINADEREIVFTKNATESINLVMYAWALRNLGKGDRIVLSIMEHHANLLPWLWLSKVKGVRLEWLDIDENGKIPETELNKIDGKNTRLVAVTHVSNVLGTINDVSKICKRAHENGALCLIDSSQGVPHISVDMKKIDCDFLVFTGHKMLGPMGIGVLYGRGEVMADIEPFLFGGDMIERVTTTDAVWAKPPQRFEAGTPNVAGAVGLAEAVRYLKTIGMENVREHEKNLVEYALDKFSELNNVTLYGPEDPESRAGIITFNVDGLTSNDVGILLNEEGIAVRSGRHCAHPLHDRLGIPSTVRMSFYIYNTFEEIDRTVDVISDLS
ncbi:cysteine desulfurase [Candidatus Micrarchaeota archaeon]|nr:cysteine desulfurase [Candidatus Micrarchaeota archaeon]